MKSKIKSKKFALFAALLAVIACTLIGINAYLHCEKLEVGSYFYRAEENLWNLNVTMSNGVTYGMTHDDVIAIMGDADYSYGAATDSYSTLSYYLNKNYDQEVEFIFIDGVLSEIQLNDSTL